MSIDLKRHKDRSSIPHHVGGGESIKSEVRQRDDLKVLGAGDGSNREAEHPDNRALPSPASLERAADTDVNLWIPAIFNELFPNAQTGEQFDLEAVLAAIRKPCPRCAELERELDQLIGSVTRIRCIKHIAVPQQNTNEHGGGECGACIAVERDTLKAKCEALEKQNADAHQLSVLHDAATTAAVEVGFGDFETHAQVIQAMDTRIKALEGALREIRDWMKSHANYYHERGSQIVESITVGSLRAKCKQATAALGEKEEK